MEFYGGCGHSSDDEDAKYALHNAAEVGDVERLKSLLHKPEPEPQMVGEPGTDVQFMLPIRMHDDRPSVNGKDDDLCTPLHVAILNGQLAAAQFLLEEGARVTAKCDGCPALHMAVCMGTHPEHSKFAASMVELLIEHGAVVLDRDDYGRTPLHWAAVSGLVEIAEILLQAATTFASQQEMEMTDNDGEGGENKKEELPTLPEFQDKQGNTALHLAARYCQAEMVKLLLAQTGGPAPPAAIKQRNKSGLNVLHVAAIGGDAAAIHLIMEACPAAVSSPNRQGLKPVDLATKRGHVEAVAMLQSSTTPPPSTPSSGKAAHHKSRHTLVCAPPECLTHHTAAWPITRGDPPPPENVNRITVLTKPGVGILRTVDFSEQLRWDEKPRKAPMGDILRVHNWAYVRKIQAACESIPDDPAIIGHLDPDTAISRRTFSAALAAAAAVTHAVDEVVTGRSRNAFCAVRPPGHHAGPSGVVTCQKDPNGSHGFCLFNNVAIGAAYAMTVHRHAGIRRVAILDFDVHHGNGTEACVANTAPSLAKFAFSTPFGEGIQQFPVYQPWHDFDDKDNVFFASVQGYGPKAPGYMDAYVYPGSGATCDTRAPVGDVEELDDEDESATAVLIEEIGKVKQEGLNGVSAAVEINVATAAAVLPIGNGNSSQHRDQEAIEEDPDGEFVYNGGEMPRMEGPRIIDVGIPGPGSRVALWKRSWRDKILPALVKFDPDIIFVSAGFDAHKKDDINFAYIGVQEKDYEWLTDQIVQVANRCCHGRVVSVLEGGYKIQGQVVSAFARSVGSHVKALAEPNGQIWDPKDSKWEREHEKQLRAEAEAKRAAAAAAAAAQAAAAQAEEPVLPEADLGMMEELRGVDGLTGEPLPPVVIPSPDLNIAVSPDALPPPVLDEHPEDDGGSRRKRRRGNVDYVALNKKLEEEAKSGPPAAP